MVAKFQKTSSLKFQSDKRQNLMPQDTFEEVTTAILDTIQDIICANSNAGPFYENFIQTGLDPCFVIGSKYSQRLKNFIIPTL